ncbi:MAG TPA: lysylphosphatidylglycerol synthase domain-containing protein [Dehalococcoidia bacterium]|nr:lysylphosphatidylglycerol synthase domain-containing protein [Dehalococcoidia bacterium]
MTTIDAATLSDHIGALCVAMLLFALSTLLLASAWIAVLNGSTQDRPAARVRLYVAFAVAWIARYVPGTVPFFAGKVYLARNLGYRSRPLLIATGIENVLEILVAGFIGSVLLVVAGGTESSALYALAGVAAATALVALHPAVFSRLANRILTLAKREPVPHDAFPSTRTLAAASVFIALNQLTNGIALLIILRATAGAGWSDLPLVTAAQSLAGVAGLLVVIAPAGFGVRDGALAALLATRVAVGAAALAAIVMRLVSICADVILVTAALAFDWATGGQVVRGFLRGRTPAPAPPARQRGAVATKEAA